MISGLHYYALEVPDLEVAEGFLQDFGLETAEKDGALIAACPGRDQEQVRLVQAPARPAADVLVNIGGSRQRIGVAAWREAATDVAPQRLGRLGRHTIGSNFFHYNPDPWGSWIEWFSDIDQIDDCWVANDWDVPPHLWGTPPPQTFLANQER